MTTRFGRIVIVTRRTELEDLVLRFNTLAQARFYLEQSGRAFDPIQSAHDVYRSALGALLANLPDEPRHHVIDRDIVPRYLFDADDLVVAVGQDGLVSNTAKYLTGQPIFAVNPDPRRIDGPLLPFRVSDVRGALPDVLNGDFNAERITLAVARSSANQKLLAFNDLFIGARSHVSARYEIETGGVSETQSSSGVIVSTGAGSTGWLQSVYAGAAGIVRSMGGHFDPPPNGGRLPWDTDSLIYSVREPFPSRITQTSLVFGTLSRSRPLTLHSNMPANGVVFSDGIESDYLEFNSGTSLTIEPADERAVLIIP